MKITEIENMKADELKAKKSEAVEAVKDDLQLAARYVQARLDATMRDEKLGEQGRTITALQGALAAVKQSVSEILAKSEVDRNDLAAKHEELSESYRKALAEIESKWDADRTALKASTEYIDKLVQQLAAEKQDRASALALAKDRRVALAQISTLIVPLLVAE